jgi:predicted small secreted protein
MKAWKNILLVAVILIVCFVCGCIGNTVNGFGKFVGGIGDDIQDASSKQATQTIDNNDSGQ